jgi:hypothetical protein
LTNDNGKDFFAMVEFTVETASGSRLFYATEADAGEALVPGEVLVSNFIS